MRPSPPVSFALLAFAPLALLACSSNYHPEYHPVTVSNFSQNISAPAAGTGVVYVAPVAPAPSVIVVQPAAPLAGAVEAPPADFFH
jgi:hypothetical protein